MDFHEIVMKGKFQLETLNVGSVTPSSNGRMVYYNNNLYYDNGNNWYEIVSENNFSNFFDVSDLDNYYTKTETDDLFLKIENFGDKVASDIEPIYLKKDFFKLANDLETLEPYSGYIITPGHTYILPLSNLLVENSWIFFTTAIDDGMEVNNATLNLNGTPFKNSNIGELIIDISVPFGLIYNSNYGWFFC